MSSQESNIDRLLQARAEIDAALHPLSLTLVPSIATTSKQKKSL